MPVLSSNFFASHWAHHLLYVLVSFQQLVFPPVPVLSLSPVLTSLVLSHIFAPPVHTYLFSQEEIQIASLSFCNLHTQSFGSANKGNTWGRHLSTKNVKNEKNEQSFSSSKMLSFPQHGIQNESNDVSGAEDNAQHTVGAQSQFMYFGQSKCPSFTYL